MVSLNENCRRRRRRRIASSSDARANINRSGIIVVRFFLRLTSSSSVVNRRCNGCKSTDQYRGSLDLARGTLTRPGHGAVSRVARLRRMIFDLACSSGGKVFFGKCENMPLRIMNAHIAAFSSKRAGANDRMDVLYNCRMSVRNVCMYV